MEAIRKPSTAAERLAALIARYPEDRFIWIMPQLDLAGELPEHLDFMVSTRKLHDYDVYDQGGKAALRKSALMALAADAGIKWVSQMSGRQDNGSNPDIVDWQATGLIADLGGLTPITRNKHVDLERMRMRDRANKKTEAQIETNDMQRQQFKYEMAESGAVTRVVRDALGIPNVYEFEDIEKKQFVILRVILSPKAKTPEERKLILGRMMDQYMPAFPTAEPPAQPVLIEAAPDRPQIEGPREPKAPDAYYELIEIDEVPEPAKPQDASPGGEAAEEPFEPPKPQVEPPLPPGSSKITPEKIDFLQAVMPLKNELLNLLGSLKGSEEYYKLMLATTGCQHANQIPAGEKQSTFYRKLKRMIELTKENPAVKEPAAPGRNFIDDLLDMRREAFNRMAMERLSDHLDELTASCPAAQYPPHVTEIIQSGDKAKMIDLAVELVRINLMEAARMREAQNAKGGASR